MQNPKTNLQNFDLQKFSAYVISEKTWMICDHR